MFVIQPLQRMLRRDALLTQFVPSVIVFIVLVIFSVLGWQNATQTVDTQKSQTVTDKVTSVEDAIAERMQSAATLLRAGTGLFGGSNLVTYDEWQRFFDQFGVDERFQGIGEIGYAPVIDASEIPELEADMRNNGVSNYAVETDRTEGQVVPVMYTIRYDNAIGDMHGFDMSGDTDRQQAMTQARDSGTTAMSSILPLGGDQNRGVVLYRPVYDRSGSLDTVAERQQALQGFVFLAVETNEMFTDLPIEGDDTFGFIVRQGDLESVSDMIFESQFIINNSPSGEPTATSTSEQFGQDWQIQYFASDRLVASAGASRPQNILAAGLAIAFIASAAVYLLIQYRTRMFGMLEEQKLQQAKDELLSLASHQLRTPATGVKQYVGMVLDGFGGAVPDEQTKLLEQAYKSNERQLQIINEFLYVAKLGSGSLTTTKHDFDLAALVRDVAEEMDIDIQERDHKLTIEAPKELTVKADEHSVRMIVENLLSNAIKYTPAGGDIRIEATKHLRDARIAIQDNGVGIAKKHQDLLFKQFSRIPNELSTEASGSGIGLYLAQQLAVRNDGNITVESSVGSGSTFTLHLPLNRVKNITNLTNRT